MIDQQSPWASFDMNRMRRKIAQALYESEASHLGSCFSVVEILIALYSMIDVDKIARLENDRDRVILSKGHAAAAMYCTLEEFGLLEMDFVSNYHRDGSLLTGHVNHKVRAVEHSTGALGHGLPVAVGIALGMRSLAPENRVFCVCGDGELQEGSVWEAIMLWNQLKLENLMLVVDHNKISSIKGTHEVINMEPLERRFEGFGLTTMRVDGHDLVALRECISAHKSSGNPNVVIADTVKGRGATFAENDPEWHYKKVTAELLAQI